VVLNLCSITLHAILGNFIKVYIVVSSGSSTALSMRRYVLNIEVHLKLPAVEVTQFSLTALSL